MGSDGGGDFLFVGGSVNIQLEELLRQFHFEVLWREPQLQRAGILKNALADMHSALAPLLARGSPEEQVKVESALDSLVWAAEWEGKDSLRRLLLPRLLQYGNRLARKTWWRRYLFEIAKGIQENEAIAGRPVGYEGALKLAYGSSEAWKSIISPAEFDQRVADELLNGYKVFLHRTAKREREQRKQKVTSM